MPHPGFETSVLSCGGIVPVKVLAESFRDVIAVSALNSGARGPASPRLARLTSTTSPVPEHVTPVHAVPPHTRMLFAMF
eukprot:CAMPEP_0182862726 /NCGR_PEP_ID=MMETSP0034_2-20130328/6234_1 /TAXON_ID=156128 /ORGANISM="Nephroselmis pyriformis, Strain CCMP717" /LENGTH=78 /DNA_ID=CAMNT_0024994835 /DNA_START=217 /DNA_END=450 /DNA_ORIENTATION=-